MAIFFSGRFVGIFQIKTHTHSHLYSCQSAYRRQVHGHFPLFSAVTFRFPRDASLALLLFVGWCIRCSSATAPPFHVTPLQIFDFNNPIVLRTLHVVSYPIVSFFKIHFSFFLTFSPPAVYSSLLATRHWSLTSFCNTSHFERSQCFKILPLLSHRYVITLHSCGHTSFQQIFLISQT